MHKNLIPLRINLEFRRKVQNRKTHFVANRLNAPVRLKQIRYLNFFLVLQAQYRIRINLNAVTERDHMKARAALFNLSIELGE